MKRALALSLPLYLSCAAPQKTANMVVEIESVTPVNVKENLPRSEEPSSKQVMGRVTDHFEQILHQNQKQALEGMILFKNTTDSFSYNYDKGMFCNPDAKRAYFGKITVQYYTSRNVGGNDQAILTTLTDVPPFGSVDRVELFVNGQAKTPFYGNYEVSREAQKLYERLLQDLYTELELRSQNKTPWKDFALERITKDTRGGAYKLHQKLLTKILSHQQISWENIQIYNPCDTNK